MKNQDISLVYYKYNNINKLIMMKYISGLTKQWIVTTTPYPAPTWELVYSFTRPGYSVYTITSTSLPNDTNHYLELKSDMAPGIWKYQAVFTDNNDVYLYKQGNLTVTQGFLNAPDGFDNRSHAERTLENIEAVIEQRATKDQSSYSVGGVSLSRMSVDELLNLRKMYKALVLKEHYGYSNFEQLRLSL
jgi:hypothetical protein